MRKLRIGVVGLRGFNSNYSGMERIAGDLYPSLAERGHEITVYSRIREAASPNVRVVQTCHLSRSSFETTSHAWTSLAHAVALGRYDVMHLHALAPALTAPVYRTCRVPTVLTVHGLDWRRAKWQGVGSHVLKLAERLSVASIDEMVVVSRELQDYFWRTYSRRTNLIYNALDFASEASGASEDIPILRNISGAGYLAWVGRIVPEKRLEDAISAYARVPGEVALVVAGTGSPDYVTHIRRLAGRDRRIHFVGQQPRSTIRSLLRQCVAIVATSELEGFPLALMEGLAQGAPVVATDIGPHREMLDPLGEYDLIFPVGDVDALANALQQALDHRLRYRQLIRAASATLQQTFCAANMVDRTERVFLSAAARGRHFGAPGGEV